MSVLGAAAPAVSAQLYKWIDEGGGVNYGDWPPAGAKVQAVSGGTVSSVADRALVAPSARPAEATRAAPRASGSGARTRNPAAPSTAAASSTEAGVADTYAPYNDYGRRPAAAVAAAERRPADAPIARPLLPIDPAIPDMPLRPRR